MTNVGIKRFHSLSFSRRRISSLVNHDCVHKLKLLETAVDGFHSPAGKLNMLGFQMQFTLK